jgi:O-antigen/teichoic acid export membrane protein
MRTLRSINLKKFKKILGSSFGKATLILTSGSLVAQAITLLAAPILTRIFSPEELGVYALILTAESLFASVVCGRYDVSIVSEPNEKKIFPLIKLSFLISVIISAVASLGYGAYFILKKEDYSSYTYAIGFIFILLLLSGAIKILESYNNRYKEYKIMSYVYILRTSVQNLGAILLGFLKFGVLGILLPHTFGLIFGLKKQSESLRSKFKKVFSVGRIELIDVMKAHYRQPLFSAPAVFANRFSYSSIPIFVESLFGLTTLGYYWISYKALGLPLSVMSNNVAKVFYQEACREYDKTGKFINSFKKTSIILFVLAIPMVFALYFIAPPAFEIAFGDGWSKAGVYVQILAPMFGIRLVVNTISYGLQVANKQSMELALQIIFVIASVTCFILAKMLFSTMEQYLFSITVFYSIIYIIYFLYVMYCALGLKK